MDFSSDDKDNIGKTGKIDNEVFARLAAEKRKKIEELLRGTEPSVQPTARGGANKDLIRFGLNPDDFYSKVPTGTKPAEKPPEAAPVVPPVVPTPAVPPPVSPASVSKTQKAQELGLLPLVFATDSPVTEEIKVYDATLPLGADIKADEPPPPPKPKPLPVEEEAPPTGQLSLYPDIEPPPPSEQSLDTHELLRMARKEKISNFVLNALEIADEGETDGVPSEASETEQDDEDAFEYTPDSNADEIESILVKSRSRRMIQIVVTAILALVSLFIVFADKMPVSLFALTGSETGDAIQLMLQTGVLLFLALATFLVNIDAMGEGARNFIRLNASQESGALVVWIACVIQAVLVATDTASLKIIAETETFQGAVYGLYMPLAIVAVLLSQIGAYLRQTRELHGFRTIRKGGEMQHLRLQNIGDSTLIERPKGEADCAAALYVPADFSSGYFAMSDTEDMADRTNRITVPMVMALGFIIGLIAWLTDSGHRPIYFVTAFAAVNVAVMPVASAILACLPQSRAAKVNANKGIVISNQCAFDDAAAATSLMVTDEELFPVGSVLLHGIKTFGGKRMDEAIVIAASSVDKHSGPLKHMFASILEANEENCLLEVDAEAVYEPERGLISWIMGKRVLIGNRDFMREYQIELPDKDYETRFLKKGYTLLYLALGGELMAMFVVSYHIPDEMLESLHSLIRKRVKLLVDTKDSGITARLIARQLRVSPACVVVTNMEGKKAVERLTAKASALKAGVVCRGGAAEKADALSVCFKLRRMITAGFVLEAGFLIVALIINILFVLFGNYSRINLPFVLIYQLIWLVASILIQLGAGYKRP